MDTYDYALAWRGEVGTMFPPVQRAINSLSTATAAVAGEDGIPSNKTAAVRREDLMREACAQLADADRRRERLRRILAATEDSVVALAAWLRGPGSEVLEPKPEGAGRRRKRRQAPGKSGVRLKPPALLTTLAVSAPAAIATARLAVLDADAAWAGAASCVPPGMSVALGLPSGAGAGGPGLSSGSRALSAALGRASASAPGEGGAGSGAGGGASASGPLKASGADRGPSPGAAGGTAEEEEEEEEGTPAGDWSAEARACREAGASLRRACGSVSAEEVASSVGDEAALLALFDVMRLLPSFAAAAAGAGRPGYGSAVPGPGGGGEAFNQACASVVGVWTVLDDAARDGGDAEGAPALHGVFALRPGSLGRPDPRGAVVGGRAE